MLEPRVLILFITGILDLLLGVMVLLRNRRSQVNISFAFFSFSLAGWALGIAMFSAAADAGQSLFWAKEYYIAASFIAASLLYFAQIFPEGKSLSFKQKLFVLVPSLLHAGLLLIPGYLIHGIIQYAWGKEVVLGKVEYAIYTFYFLPFFYSALYILWRKYKINTGYLRKQIKFVAISILSASIFGVVFNLLLPWFGNYKLIYFGPPFTMIIFWFMVYAIIKHRLWDFRLVFVRTIVYGLLVLILSVFYAVSLFLIGNKLLGTLTNKEELYLSTVLALFMAFTIQPLKNFLQRITEKVFYKNKYDSSSLLESLTKIMASTIELEELTSRSLTILNSAFQPVRSGFYIFSTQRSGSLVIGEIDEHDLDKENLNSLVLLRKMLVFDNETDESVKQLMRKLNVSLIFPLTVGQKVQGVLLLAEKKSGDVYSDQDLKVLEIFGPEIAVAIENAKAYEEIKSFNITLSKEVQEATKDLRDANTKLQALDKLKNDFVSVASHELRTPMTAIKSYLWMALNGRGGPLTEKQLYYLNRSYNSVDRLIKLVNDMLNISRIESGRISLEKKPVLLVNLAREVMEEVLPRAEELGIAVVVENEDKLPQVFADGDKIKEVFFNLIGNSLKFTPRGGKITVSFITRDGMVEVQITDTGRGIRAEDLPKLFQKFGLISGSYTTNQPVSGTGLGLYICKAIVEMHNGWIRAYSKGDGLGATFVFALPVFQSSFANVQSVPNTPQDTIGLIHTQI